MTEKEIVVTKKIYVAVDGKEFEDEKECSSYETAKFEEAEAFVSAHATWSEVGDNFSLLGSNLWGSSTDMYYVVYVDSQEMVDALSTMATISYGYNSETELEIRTKIGIAKARNSKVLIDVWDYNILWYGTLDEVKATLSNEIESIFTV